MKKFLILLSLIGLLSASGFAASSSTVISGASTNSLVSGAVLVSDFVIANSATQALTIKFFDAPSTARSWTNAAFSTRAQYTTNITTIITNTGGVSQTNTYPYVYTYDTTVAGSTNAFAQVLTLVIPASTTLTYTPLNGLRTIWGVQSTNDQACTVTLTYSSLF